MFRRTFKRIETVKNFLQVLVGLKILTVREKMLIAAKLVVNLKAREEYDPT